MKKLCLCVLILLCGCDRPEYTVQLDCKHWDVDAQIYKDKVVMDIVNTAPLTEPNDRVPAKFLEQGVSHHLVADRFIGVMGTPETELFFWGYANTNDDTQAEDDVTGGVGLVFDYNNSSKTLAIDGISFGFSYRYECKVKFPYVLNPDILSR